MMLNKMFRITLLCTAIGFSLVGCSDDKKEMSQQEVQYLSHIDQARFFQRQGELKASTLEARSAIDLNPSSADPYFIIVDNLIEAGDAVTAERQALEIEKQLTSENTPDSVRNRIKLILAQTHLMRGQTAQARASLDALRSPDRAQNVQAANFRGDSYLADRDFVNARKAYQNALDTDANSVLAILGLSKTALAEGKTDQAKEYIGKAEAIDPNDPELWLWKAQFAQAQQNWEKSEEAYIRALEDIGQYDIMTQRKYTTISALIQVLREQGKASEAFVYQEILAKSAPGTIKSNFAAAQEAYQQGKLDEAARYLNEVLKQAPNHVQSSIMLGLIRFQQGRVAEAERLLAPVSDMDISPAASKLLAAAQLRLQRPEEARRLLENLDDKQSDPGVLALVGIASLASGDDKAGREYIEKSLELKPDNSDLRLRYARYLTERGETKAAIEQASAVMDANPQNASARALIINAYMRANDGQAAKESASAWVKEQPDSISALIVRGEIAASNGESEEAKKYYEQALAVSDKDPRAHNALGALAARSGDTQEAVRQFQTAVSIAPDNRQALQGLAQVSEPDALKSFLEEVEAKNPNAVGPNLALLELALRDNDSERADELSAKLLQPVSDQELSPYTRIVGGIYSGVAQTKLKEGKKEEALAILKRAQALFPDNEQVALQAASIYFDQNKEDRARSLLKDIREQHPDSIQPYLMEAAWEASNEHYDKAAAQYELALAKDSTPRVLVLYADALQKHGQTQKAIKALENGQNTFGDNTAVTLRLAMAYQAVGEGEKAITAYNQVLSETPQNTIALNNLAWLYHETGQKDAETLAEKAYSLDPESAAIADTYGWILYQQGDHAKSIPVLEKAYSLSPETAEIAQHLAEAYKKTGRDSDARRILKNL